MKEEDIREQLKLLIDDHKTLISHSATIKKWCLTVWVGVALAFASGKIILPNYALILILTTPVFIFWTLEAAYGGTIVRRQRQIRKAESALITNDINSIENPIELFPFSLDHITSRSEKIKDLREALIHEETLSYLYIVLIFFSFLFVSVLL